MQQSPHALIQDLTFASSKATGSTVGLFEVHGLALGRLRSVIDVGLAG